MAISMRGKVVDMEKMLQQNELAPAVGNAKYNARGDKLGPNGQIIERRADMVEKYYEVKTKAQTEPIKSVTETVVTKPKKQEE